MPPPHSLDRLWRNPPPQPQVKKPGHPELRWTPSQERKLFRLITQANVPFKHIAVAIYEPEEPAEPGKPGRPEFAPSLGTCWNHWHKMTDMKPSQMQIKNQASLKRHREQLERAFEAYQKRQLKLPDLPAASQRLSALPEMPKLSFEHPNPTPSAPTGSAADVYTPQLTFEGTTPVDLAQAILTPGSHEPIPPLTGSNETQRPVVCTPTLEGGENAKVSPILPSLASTSTKRPAPSDFDEGADNNSPKFANQSSAEQEVSLSRTLSGQPFSVIDAPGRTRLASGLSRVDEELGESNASKSKITTVAGLEEKMGVSQGLIFFVKYGLTKSRWSVQSVISRFSSRWSSQSLPAESQAPEESEPFFYDRFMTNSARPYAQSTPVQSMQPTHLYCDPQKTNLFLELRLAGATDNEVANRIRQLLQGCSQERAQQAVTARSPNKEIPLEVALALGNIPACKVLLDFGADVNAKTSDGSSLSDFGRRAQKNTNTSQQYFAIGACRNAIREGRSTEKLQAANGSKKRTKIRDLRDNIRLEAVNKAQRLARGSGQSNVRSIVPTLTPGSGDPERLSSLSTATAHESRQEQVSLPIQQSNMPYSQPSSSQQTPRPVVAKLVNYFNQGAQQPPFHDSIITPSLPGVIPSSHPWNSSFNTEGRTVIPALPECDPHPRVGHWELLPGNRMAFVLHDDYNSAMPSYERMVPPVSRNHVSSLEAEMFLGMNDPTHFPFPTVQNNMAQSSKGASRHYGMVAEPWLHKLDTVMPSNDFQLQNIQQSVVFEGTMNSQSNAMPAPSSIYDYQDYGFQANTSTSSREAQPISRIDFQQVPLAMDAPPPDSFESDVNGILFDSHPNENHVPDVPDWDWRRPDVF